MIDKRILNFIVIVILTIITFAWSFWIFKQEFMWNVVFIVIAIRIGASLLIFKDYSLSWSKATTKTFLLKTFVYVVAFAVYMPIIYGDVRLSFMLSELAFYLLAINFLMYAYNWYINNHLIEKTKEVIIYGAGRAGIKLADDFKDSRYKVKFFIDDDKALQKRSIDGTAIVSTEYVKKYCKNSKKDLLVIAMPSASREHIQKAYSELKGYFENIKILPSLDEILDDKPYAKQLKDISVEDLLARRPRDLDKSKIESFIKDKVILITGAGGSIGSELVRQCIHFGAKKLILLDHSEFNLYTIEQEIQGKANFECVMQTIVNKELLNKTFAKYKPQIVLHAAAYKHVPMVEANMQEGIINNIIGTKNCIDLSIKYNVEKFVLISTDKAVRPTNVMGATKRVAELYAQNVNSFRTEIVAVRFGNVLGSSGSVIPKFKKQIQEGGPITVTHPEITRYFMLIPEACQLVLQAGAIGKGGEIFILDMGEPIKIVDLAKKMIKLSGREDIEIVYTGLRPGEKLYEELLINDSDAKTEYESITVAAKTNYDIKKLNYDIKVLLETKDKIAQLKFIVAEFNHKTNINDNVSRVA